MKVVYHKDYLESYTYDPAAANGRIEAILDVIEKKVTFVEAMPAGLEDIAALHTKSHISYVEQNGLYRISALAAGGAIQAAQIGLKEPCFALVRPPGHHASANSSWGFCYFNNMAIAIDKLKREGKIKKAFVLDIDLHFGDGTVNLLGGKGYVNLSNPAASSSVEFMKQVEKALPQEGVDIIGISAGFDYAREDWGGVLKQEDYTRIGQMVKQAAKNCGGGYFAILEGGYNHNVLGYNCMALLEGME